VADHLSSEISTASNIKSKPTRTAVISALKSLQNNYGKYCNKGKTPENGLVMLAGRLSQETSVEIPQYL